MLRAIVAAARTADVGIQDIRFEIDSLEIDLNAHDNEVPENMHDMVKDLRAFSEALHQNGNDAELQLNVGKLKSTTYHAGIDAEGKNSSYPLTISDESDGTRRLVTMAPAIERTLANGRALVVDGLDRRIHLLLVECAQSLSGKSQQSTRCSNHFYNLRNCLAKLGNSLSRSDILC